jgi:hypothetical protein
VRSAWEVVDCQLTDAGHRYTVALGGSEWIVLHTSGGGWQDLRESIEFARHIRSGYDEGVQENVSEALTALIAKSFNIRAGVGQLRVFMMIQGFRRIPDTVGEILDILNP